MKTSEKIECLTQQLDELELIKAVYSDDIVVNMSDEEIELARHVSTLSEAEWEANAPQLKSLSFSVQLIAEVPHFNGETIVMAPFSFILEITFPKSYPLHSFLECFIDSPALQRHERNEALKTIKQFADSHGGFCCAQNVLSSVQSAVLCLKREEADENMAAHEELKNYEVKFNWEAAADTVGRRCVYYHHILSTMKRQCISGWAKNLKLRGFCKIGYPGILVVEGIEGAVEEYIRGLQRLRWKLMVVRGEETVKVQPGCTIEETRKVKGFDGIIEVNSSSDIAELCQKAQLTDLFKTCMKIYKE